VCVCVRSCCMSLKNTNFFNSSSKQTHYCSVTPEQQAAAANEL